MRGKRKALVLRISGYVLFFALIIAGAAGFTYLVNGGLDRLNAKQFVSLNNEQGWEALRGDLSFRNGNPDYSSAQWQPLDELAGTPEGKEYADTYWLRLKLPDSLYSYRDPQLSVRSLMHYEIYIEQHQIVEFNMADRSKLMQDNLEWNLIPFPNDYLGNNMYLRIIPADKGITNAQLLIGEGKDWIIELLKHDTLKLALTICFAFLFFVAAGAYLLYNREPLHLYFAILCLSASYYSFFQSSVIKLYISLPVTAYFVDIAIPTGTFAFLGMLGYLTEGTAQKAFRIATPMMLVFLCISCMLSIANNRPYLLIAYQVHSIILLLLALSSIWVFIKLRKHWNSESFWLFAGFCCFGFFSVGRYVYMMSPDMNVRTFELFPLFFYYWKEDLFYVGVFLFVLCLSMVIVSRLRAVHMQAQSYADELKDTNIRLEQFDKIKDDFLENTSHELRTPLHGMIGLSESLLDGVAGPLSAKAQHNLQLVVASGKRLTRLVNDILDIAKLKHKDIVLLPEPVKVKDITGIVLAVFNPLLREKPLRLLNMAGDELPLVMADPNRLQQILYNLIGNAVKFTPSGEITVKAEVAGGMLRIFVTDTGSGIPKDKLAVIFEPFEQAGSPPGIEGTGLGLPLTKKLVELHGGVLAIDSAPGEGTCCSFTLPLAEASVQTFAAEPAAVAAGLGGNVPLVTVSAEAGAMQLQEAAARRSIHEQAVILLVDDEPVNMQVLDNFLANEHAILRKAYSAEEALASIRQFRPDLILLDVMLPDRNGYDVCQTLRQTYSASELPVILLTAKSQLADLMQGFDAGANDYMTKPVSKQELLARVRVQLQLSQLTHSLEQLVQERTEDLTLTNRLLENSMQETAEAMAELLILEERNRIAGDIHDIVGHTLTTTIVHLEGAKLLLAKEDVRGFDKVLLSQELVRKGLEEIRESIHRINPSGDDYDLATACIQLLDRTAHAAGAEILYDISVLPPLQLQQKKAIYHALKEGLTNGLRHGTSNQFRFTLDGAGQGTGEEREIRFSLWNNGRGYESEHAGTGLRTMSQRVRQFGGTVRLSAPDQGGCLLTVTLPV